MQWYGSQKSIKTIRNYAKKKTTNYKEQNVEKVNAYLDKIRNIPVNKIAYVDETGIDTYLYREYAYSYKGTKVYEKVSGRKYKRTGIVAAQINNKIIEPLEYDGTMDRIIFEYWFEKRLLPALPKETVIVMDNASFHRKKQLFSIAEKYGYRLIFLPPYSPELNPIEKFWSKLKRYLQKVLSHFDSFDDALFDAFKVL